jgi:hypothetical protein
MMLNPLVQFRIDMRHVMLAFPLRFCVYTGSRRESQKASKRDRPENQLPLAIRNDGLPQDSFDTPFSAVRLHAARCLYERNLTNLAPGSVPPNVLWVLKIRCLARLGADHHEGLSFRPCRYVPEYLGKNALTCWGMPKIGIPDSRCLPVSVLSDLYMLKPEDLTRSNLCPFFGARFALFSSARC